MCEYKLKKSNYNVKIKYQVSTKYTKEIKKVRNNQNIIQFTHSIIK